MNINYRIAKRDKEYYPLVVVTDYSDSTLRFITESYYESKTEEDNIEAITSGEIEALCDD